MVLFFAVIGSVAAVYAGIFAVMTPLGSQIMGRLTFGK